MGVFRIARAEFIKIFKKPSVYLMGVILAAVLVLSLLFFAPTNKQNYTVKIEGSSVGQVYDKFTNDENVSGGNDIKRTKYNAIIADNLTKINFYEVLNSRNEELKKVHNEFTIACQDLSSAVKTTDSEKISNAYKKVKNSIDSYNQIYNNISSLGSNCEFYAHFTTLSIYTKAKETLQELKTKASVQDAKSFVSIITNTSEYLDSLDNIYKTNVNFIQSTLNYYADSITAKQNEYYNRVVNSPNTNQTYFTTLKNDLTLEVETFLTTLKSLHNSSHSLAFINISEYDALINKIEEVKTTIDSFNSDANANVAEYKRHENIVKQLSILSLSADIKSFSNNLIPFSVSDSTLKELKTTLQKRIEELKSGLNESIEAAKKDSASKLQKDIDSFNSLVSNYRILSLNSTNLVNNTINLEAVGALDFNNITNYVGFESFNIYEKQEELTKTKYFIESGTYNQNYNDVFAFNKNSGTKTTAYDFMFYGMEIATLIITVFAIFMSASLIASEYDSGTIKLLAMRPFKRWKIISGKLLATMIFVFLFVLFSFIICLVAGIALFPFDNTLILVTFNSTHSFAIHPMILMAINVGCILLEIFFYTVIALSISTIFRSYTAAISISCIMFILALSLNILFGGAYWYSFIPFINADLFKYFGGSFLTTSSSALNNLFTPSLLTNSNFFMSLGIYGLTVVVFLLITHIVFKVRDF